MENHDKKLYPAKQFVKQFHKKYINTEIFDISKSNNIIIKG